VQLTPDCHSFGLARSRLDSARSWRRRLEFLFLLVCSEAVATAVTALPTVVGLWFVGRGSLRLRMVLRLCRRLCFDKRSLLPRMRAPTEQLEIIGNPLTTVEADSETFATKRNRKAQMPVGATKHPVQNSLEQRGLHTPTDNNCSIGVHDHP